MKPSLVIIGAGGHSKSIIDAARYKFSIVGLLSNDPASHGRTVCGVKVLGDESLLPRLAEDGDAEFVIGVGSVGDPSVRIELFESVRRTRLKPAIVIHPQAMVSEFACIGEGTVVLAGAVIGPDAKIGQNVIVNCGAIIEHDCVLEDHVHIASGAVLGGKVTIRQGAHVGSGATIRQGQTIGKRTIIGAGSAVVSDLCDGKVFVGVPAKELKKSGSKKKQTAVSKGRAERGNRIKKVRKTR